MQPFPLRPSEYHCTCCGERGVRHVRTVRWKLRVTGLISPNDYVHFIFCAKCDLVAPRRS